MSEDFDVEAMLEAPYRKEVCVTFTVMRQIAMWTKKVLNGMFVQCGNLCCA